MKALVVYESFFGNTKRIAESIAKGLGGALEVEMTEVDRAPRALPEVDLVVVGGPTHAWTMSRPTTRKAAREQANDAHADPVSEGIGVREWIYELGENSGRPAAAAFDTAVRRPWWFPIGSAARHAASRLERRGLHMLARPQQFFVGDTQGPLEAGELERAQAWGEQLAADLVASRN